MIALAILITFTTSIHWNEVGENLALIVPIMTLGYFFGNATCHFHKKINGLMVTLITFGLLMLLHATIDGMAWDNNVIAVLLHELVRQPAMYIVLSGMLLPFNITKKHMFIVAFFTVTGTWVLGTILGSQMSQYADQLSGLHEVIELSVFLLIGDLIHHFAEELKN